MIEPLKAREVDILQLLAEGLTDREVAQRLSLSVNTVKWYNKQLYQKLDAENRTEAVASAQRLGVLSVEGQRLGVDEQPSQPPNNLPSQVTSFVGRTQEIQKIRRLLRENRLLTITGPAGCGKTRLAVRVAWEGGGSYPDGVSFVPFAPVSDADDVLWTIAEHVHFQFNPGNPPRDQLLGYFRDKEMLLVLDNFEHLLPAAATLSDLLSAAPDVKMLVTSRERLSIYGEATFPLVGLPLPNSEGDAQAAEAVQLFIQRADAVNPNWDAELPGVVRICQLVDGLPLAIELAATWSDTLTPEQIADEIEQSLDILQAEVRDLPSQKASMRAAFGRSWDLLNEDERSAFSSLSVFRGGFTREAASAIGTGLPTLQSLVKKSLVRYDPEGTRYEMHELLRQYAAEKLEASGDLPRAEQAHAAYFADFLAARWPRFTGDQQQAAIQEVGTEIENVRTAWKYSITARDWEQLAKLRSSFWVIHDIRGWYPAGLRLLGQAAEALREHPTPQARAGLGWILAAQGLYMVAGGYNFMEGFELAREGVEILRRPSLNEELFIPLICLAISAVRAGELEVAAGAARECLEVAEGIGDAWSIAKAKQLLALRAMEGEQYNQAEELAKEALGVYQTSGDRWSESVVCIEVLGMMMIRLKQLDEAEAWFHRGLGAAETINFEYSMQMAYWQLGYIEALREDYTKAGSYWEQAMSIGDRVVGSVHMITFGGTDSTGEWAGPTFVESTDPEIIEEE